MTEDEAQERVLTPAEQQTLAVAARAAADPGPTGTAEDFADRDRWLAVARYLAGR